MLPKTGIIYISARLPDGTMIRKPLPVAREYYVDAKADKSVILPIEETPALAEIQPIANPSPQPTDPSIQTDPYRSQLAKLACKSAAVRPTVSTSAPYVSPKPASGYFSQAPKYPSVTRQVGTAPASYRPVAPAKPYVFPDFTIVPKTTDADTIPQAQNSNAQATSLKPQAQVSNLQAPIPKMPIEMAIADYQPNPIALPKVTVNQTPHLSDLPPISPSTNFQPRTARRLSLRAYAGIALVVISVIGISIPFAKKAFIEGFYATKKAKDAVALAVKNEKPLPPAVPIDFNPLVAPDGSKITPINTVFSLVIPKINVNAPVIEKVNPANPKEYIEALKKGVAHASTSSTPDQTGTVYLFSHSTNYNWFVKDLNAIFYLVKDLEAGDYVVIFYKNVRYTYRITGKQIVKPTAVSYLVPDTSKKSLILQTCWPPGSIAERMLLFADLVDERGNQI